MKTKTIELSNYIAPDLYFWAKEHNQNYGESLPVRVKTDIFNRYYVCSGEECFDFCVEVSKLPMIAKAKIATYVHLYDGMVAKRISDSSNGKWQRLTMDKNKHGKDCAVWLSSCCDDDYYFAEDSAWIKATFNEVLLNESI